MDRLVLYRGENGAEFISLSSAVTSETGYKNGVEYPLIRLSCNVSVNKFNEYPASFKLPKKDSRKELFDKTPIAEFNHASTNN